MTSYNVIILKELKFLKNVAQKYINPTKMGAQICKSYEKTNF